jgi:hypothetical protein
MARPIKIETAELEALRQGREELELQIKQSRETIEQSLELLRRLNEPPQSAERPGTCPRCWSKRLSHLQTGGVLGPLSGPPRSRR